MLKKLNKERLSKGLTYFPDWYKSSSDYTKISLQTHDISLVLKELKTKSTFHSMRIRHALLADIPRQEKAELIFQKSIVDKHIDQIDKLLAENADLSRENTIKKYGEDIFSWE